MDITSNDSLSGSSGISLVKGGKISLDKEIQANPVFTVGLGWDVRSTDGQDFDLDGSVFIVGENGKIRSADDFVFYNNLAHPSGAVVHNGDNRTGEGEGDDETITLDFAKIPSDVKELHVAVSIHQAEQRKQNFGQVSNAYIRVLNNNGEVVAKFDLSEDADTNRALVFGRFYQHNGQWKFHAVGDGWESGLPGLLEHFN